MTMTAQMAVSAPTLVKRITRRLRRENQWESLRTTRGDRWRSDLGNYYIVDASSNSITASHIDIEELGRELGVLRDHEQVSYE